MMTPAERLPNGNYGMHVDRFPVVMPLEVCSIPGLRRAQGSRYMYGPIDAVAAACKLLGLDPPPQVPPIPSNVILENSPLFPFQREGVAQLAAIQRTCGGGALLADDMGLGKTLQSIYLAKLQGAKRIVVACQASARYTWLDELKKWGQGDDVALLLPKGTKRSALQREYAASAKWVISSYNLLDELPGAAPDLLVLDECHKVKSKTSLRTKTTGALAARVPWRLGLSGTPAWNRPKDWHRVLQTILGGSKFGTEWQFQRAYCDGHQGKWGWEAKGISRSEELRLRLSYYMIRREKKDVAGQLPPKTRQPIWVDGTPKAVTALRAWGTRSISLTAALDAVLEDTMPVAVEQAQNAGRFLLFTYHPAHAEAMAHQLQDSGTPCVLLTGQQSFERRRENVELARANGWGMVATLDAAGTSLNLQGMCEVGIMHALDYVPFKMAQAEDRIYRMGIDKPVNWYYIMMRDSAQELVWQTVKEKIGQATATMNQTATAGLLELEKDAEKQSAADVYETYAHWQDVEEN